MTIAESDRYSVASKANASRVHSELLKLDIEKFSQRLDREHDIERRSRVETYESKKFKIRPRSRSINCLNFESDASENDHEINDHNHVSNYERNLLKSKKDNSSNKCERKRNRSASVTKKQNLETIIPKDLCGSSPQLSIELCESSLQLSGNDALSETSSLSSSIEFELNAIENLRLKNRRNGVVINTFEKPKKRRGAHFQLRKFSLQYMTTKHNKRLRNSAPVKESNKNIDYDQLSKKLPGMSLLCSDKNSFHTDGRRTKHIYDLRSQSDTETILKRAHSVFTKKMISSTHEQLQHDDGLKKVSTVVNESKITPKVDSLKKKGLCRSLPFDLNKEKQWPGDIWFLFKLHNENNKEMSQTFSNNSIEGYLGHEKFVRKSSQNDASFNETNRYKVVITQNPILNLDQNHSCNYKKKKLSRSYASLDLPLFQRKENSLLIEHFFSGFKASLESKLISYLSDKIYEPRVVGDWCRTLSESIKDQIVHVTGDSYKVTCQIFISAVYDKGAHIATQSSYNKFTDFLFTVAYHGEEIFALATAAAVLIS